MKSEVNPVSEACLVIAEVAPQLPHRTRVELTRLLEHSVAAPTDQELREMRLGLLVELVRDGELPNVGTYQEARSERATQGEEWPDAGNLTRHFGNWASTCRAAADLAFNITKNRVKTQTIRLWPKEPYTRLDVEKSLRRASRKVGQLIGQWEYVELRRVERRLAAVQGRPDPRFPELRTICRCFGSWDHAIASTQRSMEAGL